jgi:lysophospholipase L1-like esterase
MKRVLCYGDSLTAGYHSQPEGYSPYGDHVRSDDVSVDIIGLSGFTTQEMLNSVNHPENEDCFEVVSKGLCVQCRQNEYDVICLMAGTNDLGGDDSSNDIIQNIDALVQICLEHVFRVVLCSIPSMGMEAFNTSLTERRNEVNIGIKRICEDNPKQLVFIDAAALLPQEDIVGSCGERSCNGNPIWDADGLHLSPHGSRLLGECIKLEIAKYTVM